MQDRRNEEVPRSQHRVVWIADIAYDYSAHRNVCSVVHRLEASRRIMHRHWPAVERIAAAPNISRRTHRHQVRPRCLQIATFYVISKNVHAVYLYLILSFIEKASLLSRLFRRSGRSKQRQIETFSAQFPPAEWFNSKAVHLHSVGTQTRDLVRTLLFS